MKTPWKIVPALAALVVGCAPVTGSVTAPATTPSSPMAVKTAGIKMITVDGKYKVWTKKIGQGKIKVLLLHGGPGATHEYLESFEDFLPQEGIEFYYYDQLGSGNSDVPTDPSLWTIERFTNEVEQVRQGLGLDQFYLYGHSWGGMLALEYALKYPKHLKGMIASNNSGSTASEETYLNQLRSQLPAEAQAILAKYEAAQDFKAPEYQNTMMTAMYAKHFCRLDPWPEPLNRTFKRLNDQVYETMQGASEFLITGNFKSWDIWDRLPLIQTPTLVIGAVHDSMNPEDIKREGRLLPNSRTLITNGSHMSMWDDQQTYFSGLIGFLKDVDNGSFKKAL